jgi:hypothetical protein
VKRERREPKWYEVSTTVDGKEYTGMFQITGPSRLLCVEVRFQGRVKKTHVGGTDAPVIARQLLSELVRGV